MVNSRLKPGLHFRIRESSTCRRLGLSPHTAKGWITFIDDFYISFLIESGGLPVKQIRAKVTFEEFQILFSILPFEPERLDLVAFRSFEKLFISTSNS